MRNFFCFSMLLFTFLFTNCATTKNEGSFGLDEAITEAANEIVGNLPQGTKIAVVNFASPSIQLSEYVIEELSLSLAKGRRLVVVDRRELELLRNEMNFQLSGEVDDESISSIGRILGAQYIITGSFADAGTFYRFRVSAINVENAAREAPVSLVVNKSDRQVSHFLASTNVAGQDSAQNHVQNPLIGDWIGDDTLGEDTWWRISFRTGNMYIVFDIDDGKEFQRGTYDEKTIYNFGGYNFSYSMNGGRLVLLSDDGDGFVLVKDQ